MKLHTFCTALSILLFSWIPNASAIDQVILKNGDIVEGRILSDVPNRHVDIQLVNGSKKRFAQADVSSVERDVPSRSDRRMSGQSSELYLGAQLGMLMSLDPNPTNTSTTYFTWGARGGVNVAQMGDFAKLALGLSYMHVQTTVAPITMSSNQILLQLLFRKVGNTGFYFGPQVGLDLISATATTITGSISATPLVFGADLGYDYYFSDSFSIGPDVRYDHTLSADLTYNGTTVATSTATNNLRILLTGTLHF